MSSRRQSTANGFRRATAFNSCMVQCVSYWVKKSSHPRLLWNCRSTSRDTLMGWSRQMS